MDRSRSLEPAAPRIRMATAAALLWMAGCAPASTAASPEATAAASLPSPTPFPPSPVATGSPTPVCAEHGTWIDFSYDGVALAVEVPTVVYLPPCYESETIRYPTAFFLHGKPYTEAQWIDLGLQEVVEAAEGSSPPMIIVLARQPEPLFSDTGGGPGSYETEFLEGLVASVDREFRTEARAERRAVVGLSRGGVWALEIALRNPGAIDVVAALSPALAVNVASDVYQPRTLVATAPALPGHILLAAGERDWARAKTEELAAQLDGRGAPAELVIVPGDHLDPTWEALLPRVIDFLAASFGEE